MEFDDDYPVGGKENGNGSRDKSGNPNVDGNPITPLDTIRGNAASKPTENPSEPNRDTLASGESSDSDSRADHGSDSDESTAVRITKAGTPDKRFGQYSIDSIFNPRGRHPFLTDAIIDDFCNALRVCIFQELAAVQVGISVNSLKEWLRQGRIVHEFLWDKVSGFYPSEDEYKAALEEAFSSLTEADWMVYRLYQETTKARAEGERDDLEFIARARSKDWKAAAYRLKIRNRQVYGESDKTPQVNINTGDTNNTINVVDYGNWVSDDEGESLEIEATDVAEIDPNEQRTSE